MQINSLLLLTLMLGVSSVRATIADEAATTQPVMDILSFGDAASEQLHHVTLDSAEEIRGGLDEPAIRLLPLNPPSYEGGNVSFTLKVDPVHQNYITARLWGSDKGEEGGNLILWAEGKQVGYRMQSDYDLLNQMDSEGQLPGRFFYETRPLPLWMTQGKTEISLKISSLGRIWSYGTTLEQFQKKLEQPSRGIYTVYSHTNPRLETPKSEKQGAFPPATLRATAGPEVIEQSRKIVIDRLNRDLQDANPKGKLTLLADAYSVAWTPAFNNPQVITQVIKEGDKLAEQFVTDPKFDGGWMGAGPLGYATMRLWPALSVHMDEPFVGKVEGMTRRQVWSQAFQQSIKFWRTNRRNFTNQAEIVDGGIYSANRGLQLVDPTKALPEAQALRYIREAAGVEPWMDSDIVDEKGEHPWNPYAGHYYTVSRKGLTRELGYVGSYGETILRWTHDLVDMSGDEKIRQQLAKLQAVRLYFRYPGIDADGYRTMKLASEIDNRISHFPYPGPAYSAAAVGEAWGMEIAAMLPDDPIAVGVARRSIEDGQYFPYIQGRLKDQATAGLMHNVDEYEKVKALGPVPAYKFPMEDGQPDFVFSDEENAVIALKHGDTRLFVNLYFRAENAVNNVGKIVEITPNTLRDVTLRTNTQLIESGTTFTRKDYVTWMRGDSKPLPPGPEIHQAWAGEKLPVSKLPEGAISPKPGEFGPYGGRAAFYWVRYGDYLIGLNTTETNTYNLPVPMAGGSYLNLVSKQQITPQNGAVKVPPLSTVVLFLGK